MNEKLKKILVTVINVLLIVFIVGAPLLILYVMASLGAAPIYITKIIPIVGLALMAALIVSVISVEDKRKTKFVWSVFLCVCIGGAIYAANGLYRDSLATVDDRNLLLYAYVLFSV